MFANTLPPTISDISKYILVYIVDYVEVNLDGTLRPYNCFQFKS